MAIEFVTVPDELAPAAVHLVSYFRDYGYTVVCERHEVGFPYAPTLKCKRSRTTLIVEVAAAIDLEVAKEWVSYCRSANRDMRFAFGIPASAPRTAELEAEMRRLRAGVFAVMADGQIMEAIAPHDVSVNVALPERKRLSNALRRKLGGVYEQFDRSQWREGFGDAAQVLEEDARKYLLRGVQRNRITFIGANGRTKNYSEQRIRSMTLGALATAFAEIQVKTRADVIVADVLKLINKDRIGEVHKKADARTEERLRRNVGQHMWRVVDALKEIERAR